MKVQLTQLYYVGDESFDTFEEALRRELWLWLLAQTKEPPDSEAIVRIICAYPNQVISILSQGNDDEPLPTEDPTLAGDIG